MLYLGGILTRSMYKDKQWVRGIIWCNHAYVVKKHMYDIILNEFSKMDIESMRLNKQCIDWFYTEHINPKYNCFLAEEQYIVQKEDFSDIDQKVKWTNNFNWDTYTMKNLNF